MLLISEKKINIKNAVKYVHNNQIVLKHNQILDE